MKPSRIVVLLALIMGLIPVASAQGAQRTLSLDGATRDACHERWRAGDAGVATAEIGVPGPGGIDAKLAAAGGDWDLALFDASGRSVGAGASPGAQEVASGWLLEGSVVRVQACRRSGDASTARVTLDHSPLPDKGGAAAKLQLVDVATPTRADKNRLLALGMDMTEHGGDRSLGVVLHGAEDAETLRRNGFTWTVEEDDLVERTIRDRTADARFAALTRRSTLPSGRDTYRTLADYENELKDLAEANPGLVKLVELPNKTWLGRTVIGIEITTNVNLADGKPSFVNLGVHHAREWPSGEHAMEWAYELVNGFKAGDPRATSIVQDSRNIVVPIVNPDGFNASRGAVGAPAGGRDESVPDTAYIVAGASNGGEYRRKNCRLPDDSEGGNCATSAGLAENGVDPNRNYGALWGGPGADPSNPLTQTYRGPGPFSEPESRNIQWLVSRNQVTTLITNHTTAGLVLRAPGLAELGDSVDEPIYKALGDAMAMENGYFSQKSWELYDTTGTTEDWSYNVTGGLGFTFEIYCGEPNYTTGDCDDPAFHPTFATMVKEWDGTSPQADHANDTRNGGAFKDYDGKGNREAYYLAAESTIDATRHSVLEGSAPEGVTLRLTKAFQTETFPQPDGADGENTPLRFDDELDTVYEVGPSGDVEWHVNPSTRPIVAKASGRPATGPPSDPVEVDGGPAGPAGNPGDGAATPCPTYFEASSTCTSVSWNDHPFEFPVGGVNDNQSATVRFTFLESDDWDLEIYEDVNGNGVSDAADGGPVANSGNGAFNATLGLEEATLPRPNATTKYVARMINFAATSPTGYEGSLTFNPPPPFRGAMKESYTLTCELGGAVLDTQQVQIDRGEVEQLDLSACAKRVEEERGKSQSGSGSGTGTVAQSSGTTPDVTPSPTECVPGRGFLSAAASGGRGVRMAFKRRLQRPVTVDVFQQSVGRRVIGERLVARFSNRTGSFSWNGRANRPGRTVTDGYYFVRYRLEAAGQEPDVRRVALRRVNGRWSSGLAAFHRPDACGIVRSFKLTRPVFGGSSNRSIEVAVRLNRSARVSLEVLRGSRAVRRFAATTRRPGVTHRFRVASERLALGDHRFRLTVVDGGRTLRYTLTARRL